MKIKPTDIYDNRITQVKRSWRCWELLHGGDGPRGQEFTITTYEVINAWEAAKHVAQILDGNELRDHAELTVIDLDAADHHIEVDGVGTFRVRTHVIVTREYSAVYLENKEGE